MTTNYVLDCSDCVGRKMAACDDCIVSFLIDRDEEDEQTAITVDEDELRAIRVMAAAGLVPEVRHLRAVS